MTAARQCERCGTRLDGRRPQARFCSPGCRAAAHHAARSGPATAGPGRIPDPGAGTVQKRAYGAVDPSVDRLDRVERLLGALLPRLNTIEARYVARAILAGLREHDDEGAP